MFTLDACRCSAGTGQITRRPTSLIGQFIDVALRPLKIRAVTRLSCSSVFSLSTSTSDKLYVLTLKYILVLLTFNSPVMSENKVNKCLGFNSRDLRASLLSVAIIPNPFILDVSWYWIKSIHQTSPCLVKKGFKFVVRRLEPAPSRVEGL